MDKYQREASPRELTNEETKAVSGGNNSQPNPVWSEQFGKNGPNFAGPGGWREGTGREK